ncbi:hypothetical protein QPL30_23395, partial [Escherichia coli]|nr:hypothetical protein [Escherichia coli]
ALKPPEAGISDDLIQNIAIRKVVSGASALRTAWASCVQSPRYYRALMTGDARYEQKSSHVVR